VDRFVVGDHADEACWPALLDGAECVVHSSVDWGALRAGGEAHLRSNLVGSIRLLHAAAPRQFIYLSSVAVHHDIRPRWEGVIDEDHPPRPGSAYGACKAAVESHLWAAHLGSGQNTSAVRPAAVYGIDPVLTRSIGHPIIEQLRRERRYARPGGGKFVHVEDVAQVVVRLMGSPEGAGRSFTLADCYARWGDLAMWGAEHMGIRAEVDLSSPPLPRNTFSKEAAQSLGVALDRGHEGIRRHLAELIAAMG
jgi:nucleoside-diphosphate-sugar epimerase